MRWDSQLRANSGDSWCICMWAFARMISTVGCDDVHLHCDSTDVSFVRSAAPRPTLFGHFEGGRLCETVINLITYM